MAKATPKDNGYILIVTVAVHQNGKFSGRGESRTFRVAGEGQGERARDAILESVERIVEREAEDYVRDFG